MAKKNLPLCPVSRAAMILGSRWTTEILRELIDNESRRFQDIQEALTGIGPSTLSNRLKMLEDHGVVERRFYDDHPPRAEYILTDKGRKMGPIFRAMRKWGSEAAD